MRIVAIGDVHLYRLALPPWSMLSKRLLGQTNLWLNRRYRFDGGLLAPTVARACELEPEGVLLSGDLTTTALPGEFADAAAGLAPLLDGPRVAVAVPGNHDRYTFTAARVRRFERMMGPWTPSGGYPHMRQLTDRWRLVALDVTRPTVISSRGRAGAAQLEALRAALASLSPDDGAVVLCHYPIAVPAAFRQPGWEHRLADAAALRSVLADCRGRVLLVHGHVHHAWHWPAADGLSHVTDLNAGSPTLRTPDQPYGQGFWEVDLPDAGEPVARRHILRAVDPPTWDTIET